jgi:1,4-alpha-glucan branching enzyme
MVHLEGEWVEFMFYRPGAQQVHLAGDFNGWQLGQLPMSRKADGHWHARMRLPGGEFKFRYCADGAWYTDYAAFGIEPSDLGGFDSIVRVPAPTLRLAAPTSDEQQSAAA